MATRVFSEKKLEAVRSFPSIGKEELIRYLALTSADEAFLRKFLFPQTALGPRCSCAHSPGWGSSPTRYPARGGGGAARLRGVPGGLEPQQVEIADRALLNFTVDGE
ncbi:hypothetical protein QF035_010378 [Streptomyces umbrinus]|uniref:Uncharacterized protein n=1 Tax=Streptomyces umbrinus TaxID=67370 RepID=A0ABU0TAF8_9ACTN|nr:hypothetical protein [Streptomyces umbrinus]